jgi:hypothetical protein
MEITETLAHRASSWRDRIGALGRRAKQLDLRQTIVDHPLQAVGIGLAVGAVVGLVRPRPVTGRFSDVVIATIGAIAVRLLRESAIEQMGTTLKAWFGPVTDAELVAEPDPLHH